MTAQIDDFLILDDHPYAIAGISTGEIFKPKLLGLNPVDFCSACAQGFQAIFYLNGSELLLGHLLLNDFSDTLPIINGVPPSHPVQKSDFFNVHYNNIGLHMKYSGGLLLADGFIDDLYIHLGFHPAWKYKTVIELIFLDGYLQIQTDISDKIENIRDRIIEDGYVGYSDKSPTLAEINYLLDGSYTRTYKKFG